MKSFAMPRPATLLCVWAAILFTQSSLAEKGLPSDLSIIVANNSFSALNIDVGPEPYWYRNPTSPIELIALSSANASARDFGVDLQVVTAMKCGDRYLLKWKLSETLPWKLTTQSMLFSVNDANFRPKKGDDNVFFVSENMEGRGAYSVLAPIPDYTEQELRRAINEESNLDGLADESTAGKCLAAIWGDHFTVRYKGQIVRSIYSMHPRSATWVLHPEPAKVEFIVLPASFGNMPGATAVDRNLDYARHIANWQGLNYIPEFAASKSWPGDAAKTIVVYSSQENGDPEALELNILIVRTADGQVLSSLAEPLPNEIELEAESLQGISLDTANYAISKGIRAFGVRKFYHHQGRASSDAEMLSLYVLTTERIKRVVTDLPMNSSSSSSDDCGDTSDTRRTISIDNRTTNGFSDLILRETFTETKHSAVNDACTEESTSSKKTYDIKFGGERYVVPAEIVFHF